MHGPAAEGPLIPGTVVRGRYKVVQVLDRGKLGAVYLVEDQQSSGRRRALKEIWDLFTDPDDRAQAWQKFEREAQTLMGLYHPGLPRIEEYFSRQGRIYIVMEYLEGQTLDSILRQSFSFLPEEQVVDWALQLCDVLDTLHSQEPPIIFSDLRPANIILDRKGRLKLLDFGFTYLFDPARLTNVLKAGTVGYAPPEQYAGPEYTGPWSDIYALGITLHELLTRYDPTSHPFVLPPPRKLNPAISHRLSDIIVKATELDASRRYRTIMEMERALLALQAKEERLWLIFAVSVAGLILAGLLVWGLRGRGPSLDLPPATSTPSPTLTITSTPSPTPTPTLTPRLKVAPTITPTVTPTRQS